MFFHNFKEINISKKRFFQKLVRETKIFFFKNCKKKDFSKKLRKKIQKFTKNKNYILF